MKKFLPWLLVPLAAWLGHRESAVSPALAAAANSGATPIVEPAEPSPVMVASAALAREDLAGLLRQLGEALTPDRDATEQIRIRLICARLAELDPVAGLEWISKQDPDLAWGVRDQLLMEWALLNSTAAWNSIAAGPEGDGDRYSVTGMLLHEDREIFMDWFRRVRKPMPDGDPAWLLVVEHYEDELQQIADDLIKQLEQPKAGRVSDFAPLFELLARHRAGKDPAGTLEWSLSLAPSVRNAAISGALGSWADVDPRGAWSRLVSLETSTAAIGKIGEKILTEIARDDPAAAMKMIQEAKGTSGIYELGGTEAMRSAIAPAIARGDLDPIDAYRLLNSAKGSASNLPLNVLGRIWFGMTPELLATAARDISAEPDEGHRDTALGGIMAAWMKNDPQAAIGFAASLPDEKARSQMLAGAMGEATGGVVNPDRLTDRLAMMPADSAAGIYVAFATRSGNPVAGSPPWMYGNPEPRPDRIAPLLGELPPSPELNRAVGITALKWGELDPASALDWAGELDDPAARTAAYAAAIDGWSFHDPMAAAAWISDAPAGTGRDAATSSLVRRLNTSDPAAAWEWTATIGESALQKDQRIETLQAWAKQSPSEAQAAFQSYVANLPPAEAADFTRRYSAK